MVFLPDHDLYYLLYVSHQHKHYPILCKTGECGRHPSAKYHNKVPLTQAWRGFLFNITALLHIIMRRDSFYSSFYRYGSNVKAVRLTVERMLEGCGHSNDGAQPYFVFSCFCFIAMLCSSLLRWTYTQHGGRNHPESEPRCIRNMNKHRHTGKFIISAGVPESTEPKR